MKTVRRTVPAETAVPVISPALFTMPVIGKETSVGTREEAIRLRDESSHLQMWVNKVTGGTVDHKTEKRQGFVDTKQGRYPSVEKVSDDFIVRPTWPSPAARQVTVTVRISYSMYGGGDIPRAQTSNPNQPTTADSVEFQVHFQR